MDKDYHDATVDLGPDEPGVLERIIEEIVQHDAEHPDHGIGCACHDGHASEIRKLIRKKIPGYPETFSKSVSNFLVVLNYVIRTP